MRRLDWVSTSLTDEAIYGSAFYALFTQYIYPIPEEWPRTWTGYGQRFGAHYLDSATEGTVEYGVAALFHEDPRHVTYYSDPKVLNKWPKRISNGNASIYDQIEFESHTHFWVRLGHAGLDSISDRVATPTGNGHRLPALSRAAGILSSTYSGYLWYPTSQNTRVQQRDRALLAFGANVGGSVFTEFGDDLAGAGSKVTHWAVHIFYPSKSHRPVWSNQ